MPSISQSRELGMSKLESGEWAYIPTPAAPPAIPAPSTAYPAAPNPYLRAPLPDSMWQEPDAQRQFHISAIPQTRLSPLPANTDPVAGAQAASQAIQIIQSTPSTPSTSTTDVDIITATNRQSFGSLDSFYDTTLSTGNGGASTLTAISIIGSASSASELAIASAVGVATSGTQAGGSPGVGWSLITANIGYSKVVPAGSLTVSQTVGVGCYNIVQTLALFKTNGGTPAFTSQAAQSGGTTCTSAAFTPTAGNSLLWIVTTTSNNGNAGPPSVSDTVGLNWQMLTNVFVSTLTGGSPNVAHTANIVMYYAQNVPATSMTSTLNIPSGGGTWRLFEISNIGNVSSGSYTFLLSDLNKLVQFAGGANVTATLPSPALASGWQALVSNNSAGTTSLTPASGVFLNNGIAPVVLSPGGSTWVFSDGSNYWTSTTALPQKVAKTQNQWLDSFDPISGIFTQSQPLFSNLGGNIAIAQMASGSGANASSFFRGDNTWNQVDYNNLSGVNKATAYNGFTLVSAGLIGEVATADLTAQAAAIAATTIFATPNGTFGAPNGQGMYEISYVAKVTTAATTSSTLGGVNGFQILYTDKDDSVVVTTPAWWSGGNNGAAPASASLNTTQTVISGTIVVYAKLGTNIQYKMDYTSTGVTAMQYNLHIKVKALL